ncbi:hypothetical protein [Armatimonas rosea]|uniref:Glycosyltransferase involved in cell wall biosynthesis n=1 Tax=Armatimonas rosea TaxID=685828 RepID=A0A7W9SU01_ARMRO|nr:hypothetical protein [Armatimonas rosea]MBB6052796.1 glycosyltransferase involved in cell wall biosynthesis [Armatimonas rosea]
MPGVYKQLLFMSDYPPGTVAGAPVIVRQLLRHYDMEKLDVFCCRTWHENQKPVVTQSFLPCPHTTFESVKRFDLRPRRFFSPIQSSIDCGRIKTIVAKGKEVIAKRGVEAILTAPYGCEFSMAAYYLSKELNIPLYVFITDDWDKANPYLLPNWIIDRHHTDFLKHAERLWLISPSMIRVYKERFGVDGEFMHHFLEADACKTIRQELAPPDDKIALVYTGSINNMFESTMQWFCDWLNQGLEFDGKPVELTIYTQQEPTSYLGPAVKWGGFVAMEEIPQKLAQAHLATILISFTDHPVISKMIRTSIYTKTIDYLATGTPTLVVSPPYAAEVEYFKDATSVVTAMDKEAVKAALLRLLKDAEYTKTLQQAGFDLVEQRHSRTALQRIFLRHFEK